MAELSMEQIQSAYDEYDGKRYPEEFLSEYVLMECLQERKGADTFLARGQSGGLCIAKCYDKSEMVLEENTELIRSLEHQGLPHYVGRYENDQMTVVVREYIEGTALDQYAAENTLTRERIVEICLELCDIVGYLHHRNEPVIHRDIKPQNVIVREDGSVVLIDFDIARVYHEGNDTDTRFFGTVAYAPPEQYGFSQTDQRADIYALGILLRYLLTGSTRKNDNIRLYRPLEKIIEKCTAFSPDDRYSDITELQKELKQSDPASQRLIAVKRGGMVLLAAVLLGIIGYQIYDYMTFDPYGEGHIPSVLQDEERAKDAVDYLAEKYGTHIFDDTGNYVTMGMMRDALTEIYGIDKEYAHAISDADPPEESDKWFFPWGKGNEQYITSYELAYAVVKVYWPDVVTDWSSLRDDNGEYPGSRVAYNWCQKYGIFTGVKRPYDMTQGEAAIAFANADRVYTALKEKEAEK